MVYIHESQFDNSLDCISMKKKTGSYILTLYLSQEQQIQIGRLGTFLFKAGYYWYVGSAMGGLTARLKHHLSPVHNPHWHMDYLKSRGQILEIWTLPNQKRDECILSDKFANSGLFERPVTGFGASDCKCRSHLFYRERNFSKNELPQFINQKNLRLTPLD